MRKCLQMFNCPKSVLNYFAPPTYQDLKIALIKGERQKISFLLTNDVPVTGTAQTILHFCVTEKNLPMLKKFCHDFPDLIDERNDDGDSPLMLAIFQQYRQAIQLLIKISKPTICDNNGNTSFIIAAANGDINTLQTLIIRNRQTANAKNFQGQNALHRACYFGQLQTVVFLINKTHLKFGMKDQKGNTSFHLACQGLSFNVARYIIRKVQNWKEILVGRNKEGNDPFDIMLQSLHKIGQKSIKYTKQELQIAIIGARIEKESIGNISSNSELQIGQ